MLTFALRKWEQIIQRDTLRLIARKRKYLMDLQLSISSREWLLIES